jgi:hypothetical protein
VPAHVAPADGFACNIGIELSRRFRTRFLIDGDAAVATGIDGADQLERNGAPRFGLIKVTPGSWLLRIDVDDLGIV